MATELRVGDGRTLTSVASVKLKPLRNTWDSQHTELQSLKQLRTIVLRAHSAGLLVVLRAICNSDANDAANFRGFSEPSAT